MKNYIIKKSIIAAVFVVLLIAIEMITLGFLDLMVIPLHWYIDLIWFLGIALLGFFLPLTLQLILTNLALLCHTILSLINVILYASSGRIFDIPMIWLAREAMQVTTMIEVPIFVTIVIAALIVGYIVFSIIIRIKSREKLYTKFIRKLAFIICSIVCVICLAVECIIPVILTNNYDERNYFTSSKYMYTTFESTSASLAMFGMWGFYVTDFMRRAFPKLEPQENIVYSYQGREYNSVLDGVCKDDNVIFILAESFEDYAITSATTPLLYALKNGIDITEKGILDFYNVVKDEQTKKVTLSRRDFDDNLNFNGANIFENLVEGEVGLELNDYKSLEQTHNSEHRLLTGNFETHNYSLPNVLKNNGYATNYVHGNYGTFYDRISRMGAVGFNNILFYDNMIGKIDCSELLSFFVKDKDIVNYYLANETEFDLINDDKFFTFMMTIATHGGYGIDNAMQAKMIQEYVNKFAAYTSAYPENNVIKLYNAVEDAKKKEELKNYLTSAIDTEEAVALLVNELYEKNELKDTIIVFVSDHNSYANGLLNFKRTYLDSIYGKGNYYDMEDNTVPAFIYSSKIKNQELKESGFNREISHLTSAFDIAPTLLTLLDVEFEQDNYLGYAVINSAKDNGEVLYNSVCVSTTGGFFYNDKFYGIGGTYIDYLVFDEPKEYIEDLHNRINEYYNHKYHIIYK